MASSTELRTSEDGMGPAPVGWWSSRALAHVIYFMWFCWILPAHAPMSAPMLPTWSAPRVRCPLEDEPSGWGVQPDDARPTDRGDFR